VLVNPGSNLEAPVDPANPNLLGRHSRKPGRQANQQDAAEPEQPGRTSNPNQAGRQAPTQGLKPRQQNGNQRQAVT